jgi:hypothetical protein
LVFSYHFKMLMPKIILKKYKKIILIYFWVKYTLKNNRKYTLKHIQIDYNISIHRSWVNFSLPFLAFFFFFHSGARNSKETISSSIWNIVGKSIMLPISQQWLIHRCLVAASLYWCYFKLPISGKVAAGTVPTISISGSSSSFSYQAIYFLF